MTRNALALIFAAIGPGVTPAWSAPEIPSFVARCVEKDVRTVRADNDATQGQMEFSRRTISDVPTSGAGPQRESFAYRAGDDVVEHISADTKAKIVGRTAHTLVIVDTDLPSAVAAMTRIYVINTTLKQVVEARAAGFDIFGSGLSAATVEFKCEFSETRR